tara:strand:+ start:6484 stop:7020 length:537 start_codon:yes stop_codon:yes gene_type:complete
METLARSIDGSGKKNILLDGSSFVSKARTLTAQHEETLVTPIGLEGVVLRADVEIERWVTDPLEDFLSREMSALPANRSLLTADTEIKPKIVSLYLTEDGRIRYKIDGHAESYLSVSPEEIPQAEELLKNIRFVGYKDSHTITMLIGEDDNTITFGIAFYRPGGFLDTVEVPAREDPI